MYGKLERLTPNTELLFYIDIFIFIFKGIDI